MSGRTFTPGFKCECAELVPGHGYTPYRAATPLTSVPWYCAAGISSFRPIVHVCLEYQRNRLAAVKDHVMELKNAGEHIAERISEAASLGNFEKHIRRLSDAMRACWKRLTAFQNNSEVWLILSLKNR